MSDNEAFVSAESNSDEEGESEKKDLQKRKMMTDKLDSFLNFDIDYLEKEEKNNYIGPPILQRTDLFQIEKNEIKFLSTGNTNVINKLLCNRKPEEKETFHKLKKELYTIAWKNEHNQKNNIQESDKRKESTEKTMDTRKKSNEFLSKDLGSALGNKIEDTYNDIKNSVNWIGNFFLSMDSIEEKKPTNIFYEDLYFFNDISIIRFLDTYKYNMVKTLNKIIKCISWRQMCVTKFNYNMEQKTIKGQKDNSVDTKKRGNIYLQPNFIKNGITETNMFRCGFDNKSRPMLYVKIQEKLKIQEDELFLTLVYHVDMCMNSINYEICYDNNENNQINTNKNQFDETQMQIVIVVDCLKFDLNNMISVDCIKKIITIFNEFYTDVLYRIYIISVPSFFKKVWSLFNMFIDNQTLKKIIIINKTNINLMYEHISPEIMKHFDRTEEKKNNTEETPSIFFPSTSLYYKHDEKHYENLNNNVHTWVNKMITLNH